MTTPNRRTIVRIAALVALTLAAASPSTMAQAQTAVSPSVEPLIIEQSSLDFAPAAPSDKIPSEPAPEKLDLSTIDAQSLTPQLSADVLTGSPAAESTDAGSEPDSLQDSVQDAIDPCWDVDDWGFYAVAGQQVVITMNKSGWGNLDSFISLYNPYGELRAVDDDSGGNQNSRLVGTIGTTGTYLIRAQSFDHATVGGYVLSVSLGSSGCGGCPPPPCGGCEGSVSVYDRAYYSGGSYTVRPGYRLRPYPGQETSIRFNGSCRSGGCLVAVYRYSGWTGETYRAETIYSDDPIIELQYDNAIEYVDVYLR